MLFCCLIVHFFITADDEQSDFFHEPGPVCGIPEIIRWWENERVMDSDMAAGNQEFDSILFGTLAHLPESSQRSFRNRVDKLMARAEVNGQRKIYFYKQYFVNLFTVLLLVFKQYY